METKMKTKNQKEIESQKLALVKVSIPISETEHLTVWHDFDQIEGSVNSLDAAFTNWAARTTELTAASFVAYVRSKMTEMIIMTEEEFESIGGANATLEDLEKLHEIPKRSTYRDILEKLKTYTEEQLDQEAFIMGNPDEGEGYGYVGIDALGEDYYHSDDGAFPKDCLDEKAFAEYMEEGGFVALTADRVFFYWEQDQRPRK